MSPEENSTEQLLKDRGKVHGNWRFNSNVQYLLKNQIRLGLKDRELEGLTAPKPWQVEALEMICVKMARIIAGDPNHPDHWRDICGYALLGMGKSND